MDDLFLSLVADPNSLPEEQQERLRQLDRESEDRMEEEKKLICEVVSLHGQNEWKTILGRSASAKSWPTELCWVRPVNDDVLALANCLKEHNLATVTSVGCGTGLYEYLLARVAKDIGHEVDVKGYEVKEDRAHDFIRIVEVEGHEFYRETNTQVLMVMFGCRSRHFYPYLEHFRGTHVLIAGDKAHPYDNSYRYSPSPDALKQSPEWKVTQDGEWESVGLGGLKFTLYERSGDV